MRQDHRIPLIRAVRSLCLLPIVALLATSSLFAQDSGSIAKALLALRTLNGNVRSINGRLYAGRIDSSITHLGGTVNEVLAGDAIAFYGFGPQRQAAFRHLRYSLGSLKQGHFRCLCQGQCRPDCENPVSGQSFPGGFRQERRPESFPTFPADNGSWAGDTNIRAAGHA